MSKSFRARFTLYQVLGVSPESSTAEIKGAFRRLAQEHHPDKHGNSPAATSIFKTIHNAYTVLSDPDSRRLYDGLLGGDGATDGFAAARPGSGAGRKDSLPLAPENTLSILLHHLNFILWDIEDLAVLQPRRDGSAADETTTRYLLMMLTFIDRWVLQTAGLPDYFFHARRLNPPVEIGGVPTLPHANIGHQPYSDVPDYFYNVRRRADELLRKSKLIDFFTPPAGATVSLADCILEAHNYCVHYLGWLDRQRADGTRENIPVFKHSQQVFECA